MTDQNEEATEGVEFGEIDELLDDIVYPITTEEVKQQYGDAEVGRTNAEPISLHELLDHMGEDTFDSEQEFRETIMGQMPRDSEGYGQYSDSRGYTPDKRDDGEDDDGMTTADLEEGPSTDEDIQGGQVDSFDDVDQENEDEDESVDDDADEDTTIGQ